MKKFHCIFFGLLLVGCASGPGPKEYADRYCKYMEEFDKASDDFDPEKMKKALAEQEKAHDEAVRKYKNKPKKMQAYFDLTKPCIEAHFNRIPK